MRKAAAVLLGVAMLASAENRYEPFAWKNVNLQGMGFVTVLTIHPKAPHDIYIGTDVGGAYRFDRAAQRWIPITDRIGPEGPGSYGIEAMAVDPNDVNTVYAAMPYEMRRSGSDASWAGDVVVSRDRGASWAATGLAAHNIYMGPNEDQRGLIQDRLAVDPQNGKRLYFASRRNGLWIRDDGGWRKAGGGLPDGTAGTGVTFIVVDASSGKTPEGFSKRLYAGVNGSGVWMSDDAGASWTNIQNSTNPTRATVSKTGVLYVSFGAYNPNRGAVRRYRSGQWADVTPSGRTNQYWAGIAVDPTNEQIIMAATDGNLNVYRSTNHGDSWTPISYSGTGSRQPGYFVKPNASNYDSPSGGWGNAGFAIDPANHLQVWQTNGYGVLRNNDVTASGSNWEWVQNNLEELVPQRVVVPPVPGGADLLLVGMDMVGFRVENRDRVPETKIAEFPWVAQGNSMAYAAKRPEYVAFVGFDQTTPTGAMTGWSSDNGRTWKTFESTPGRAGNIAMAADDPLNMVWTPASGSTPIYTRDGGKTWQKAKVAGGGDLQSGWTLTGSEWWAAQVLAADPVENGKFYYCYHATWNSACDLYASSDGGANWTKQGSLAQAGRPVGNTIRFNLVPNPTRSGDLWLAHRRNGNQDGHFLLARSQDGGRTWATINTMKEVSYVAFGRGHAADRPFVYVFGLEPGSETEAVYKSEDMGETWIRISDPGQTGFADVVSIEGDMRVRDLVYVAVGGRGVFYGYGAGSGLRVPSFSADGVVNAASYEKRGVAPGEIVTVFGTDLGPSELKYGWGTTVAEGTQVFFDGIPAPVVYASAGQTSAFVPFHVAGRQTTTMQVMVNGALSLPVEVPVVAAKPGIFTRNAQGSGQAVVVHNTNGSLNAPDARFARGTDVYLYVAGAGQTDPAGTDGMSNGPVYPLVAREVKVTVGGITVPAQWAGGAPGFLQGLTQVNFRIPQDAPAGDAVPLTVTVGDATSAGTATMAIF